MADLSYRTAGAGPCLLLLHPFPFDSRIWQGQVDVFAATHQVVLPDLRGFGRSRSLGPATSMEQMAQDVVALMDELKIERANILGLSMGGYAALSLLAQHPDRVERLILCDTRATGDTAEARQGRARQLAVLHGGGIADHFNHLLPRLVSPDTGDAIRETLRQIALDQTIAIVSGTIVAMRERPDHSDTLRKSTIPILGIVGSGDQMTPPDEMQTMVDLTPQGVLEKIPGVGHLSCIENPDIFNRTVLNWLAS